MIWALKNAIRWDVSRTPPVLQVLTLNRETPISDWAFGQMSEVWVDVPRVGNPPTMTDALSQVKAQP